MHFLAWTAPSAHSSSTSAKSSGSALPCPGGTRRRPPRPPRHHPVPRYGWGHRGGCDGHGAAAINVSGAVPSTNSHERGVVRLGRHLGCVAFTVAQGGLVGAALGTPMSLPSPGVGSPRAVSHVPDIKSRAERQQEEEATPKIPRFSHLSSAPGFPSEAIPLQLFFYFFGGKKNKNQYFSCQ